MPPSLMPPGTDYLNAPTPELFVTSNSVRAFVCHLLPLQVSEKDLAVTKILLSDISLTDFCTWGHLRSHITVLKTKKPRHF